ncbi:DUF4132 domain-containing protein [Jiangella alba]|uniref:DUF4132 domain-containing protein n=1 Tax=Jiangella alba TaxID=561176 RepID=A0A1H5MX52_9ACTN|nr:DUF4132 domain-containing protein [Jiangella alba]SEE93939.1 protein of unknown function [Jiangella alba]
MTLFRKGRRASGSRTFAEALEAVFGRDQDGKARVSYVLTGSPITALTGAGNGGRATYLDRRRRPFGELYANVVDVDAAVLRRYGRILDAVRGGASWGLSMGQVGGGNWFELMLTQADDAAAPNAPLPITFADLARAAAVDGADPADLIRATLELPQYARYAPNPAKMLARLPGYAEALVEHRTLASAILTTGSVDSRVRVAQVIGAALSAAQLEAFTEPLAEAATASSTQVREAARGVLARVPDAAVAPLRRLAVEAKPDQRGHAIDLLAAMPEQLGWALETARADRAATVRAVGARWEAAESAPAEGQLELPEPEELQSWGLPRAEADALATQVTEAITAAVGRHNDQIRVHRQSLQTHPRFRGAKELSPPSSADTKALARFLAASAPPSVQDDAVVEVLGGHVVQPVFEIARDRLDAVTAVKLLAGLHLLVANDALDSRALDALEGVHARTGGPDLLTLQRMLDQVGVYGRAAIWRSYCSAHGTRLGRAWPDEQVWTFVAANLDWLLSENPVSGPRWNVDEHAVFVALATLPAPPARVIDHLYALAVGPKKADRAPAQAALARDPNRAVRAATALGDGRSETRLAAARWLTEIADPVVLPELQAAWKGERQDVVRGALLEGLVAVGEDVETYLDPAAATVTAEKFVAKGMPASLSWLDWGAVPAVTWASSGQPVPRAVVQWLCAIAVKARSPEPNAVLRHFAELFDRDDREKLALHMLAGWIAEDLRPITAAEAERQAAAHASSWHHSFTSSPDSPYYGMSVDELIAALLPGYARQPAGSATASKGLLAVVAACGGAQVVAPAERYLREWYGQRASQGKALIGMLAWVEDPVATQVVLAIGSRFRTKSFQDEAVRQAQALADRKGWTVDELADRTMPTAGFDEHGVLDLPYGDRTFTARLLPDLTVELRDPDGKTIKALPTPRASDDADQAKDSKKALTAAKKQLKSIASLQTARLYEAMCTQRSWPAEDWNRYLLTHPVVGPALRRLVWVAWPYGEPDGHQKMLVFRPLDDGSLTDVDDNEVTLPASGQVAIAHDTLLTPDQAQAWAEHLADYEVTPLFEQLGRGVHAVTDRMRTQKEITDFRGHLLMTFALRGKALKLGWTRGPAEDGGWFTTYTKRFPTLGITAIVDFTGNPLPEENRLVALTGLHFVRQPAEGRSVPITVGEVPAVLLSECWHDMRLMAAEGTGFDPDWEKKAQF